MKGARGNGSGVNGGLLVLEWRLGWDLAPCSKYLHHRVDAGNANIRLDEEEAYIPACSRITRVRVLITLVIISDTRINVGIP